MCFTDLQSSQFTSIPSKQFSCVSLWDVGFCVSRSQFSHGEGSKKPAAGKTNAGTSSTRGKKNLKKTNAEAIPQGSESWVNPKSNVGIPKDAGKRRVHAVGQSAGHWYTGPNGKRVS